MFMLLKLVLTFYSLEFEASFSAISVCVSSTGSGLYRKGGVIISNCFEKSFFERELGLVTIYWWKGSGTGKEFTSGNKGRGVASNAVLKS